MPLVKPIRGTLPKRTDPLARELFGAWLLNEGDGNLIADISGWGNNGTNNGADWVPGRDGWELDFISANSDYVALPPSFEFIPETDHPFSISGEFVADTADSGSIFRLYKNQFSSSAVRVYLISGPRLACLVSGSSGNTSLLHDISAGVSYHFVYIYDGGDVFLYVNGVQVDTSSGATLTAAASNADDGEISSAGDPLDGRISHVYFWNRGLTEPEAFALYGNHYRLFERSRTTVLVSAGGGAQNLNADAVSVAVTVPDAAIQPASVNLTPNPAVINVTVPDATLSGSGSLTPSSAVVQATVPDGTIQAGSVTLTASPAVITVVAKTATFKTVVILAPVASVEVVAKTPTITRHAPCYSVSCCPPEDLGYDISGASATDSTCGETKSCDCDDPL